MPWQLTLAKLDSIATTLREIESRSVQAAETIADAIRGAVIELTAADQASSARKLFSDLIAWAEREAAEDRQEDDEFGWQ